MTGGIQNPGQYNINVLSNKSMSAMFERNYESVVQGLNFREGEKVMDYACGPGTFFKEYLFDIAKEKKLKLIGVNISDAMIEFANKNSFLPGVTEYVIGNILDSQNWPLVNEKYDKIIASYVVQVVDDYRDLFRRFYDCLAPGGTFTTVVPMTTLHRIFNAFEYDPFWSTKCYFGGSRYSSRWAMIDVQKGEQPDFELAMTDSGFQVVEFHHYTVPLEFQDIYECLDFLISVNGPLSTIAKDSELYPKLQADLIQNAHKCLGIDVTKKPFHYDWQIYWFTGRKPKSPFACTL